MKKTKTRVLSVSNGYIPQYYQPKFLFGGYWVGIRGPKEGEDKDSLWYVTSEKYQLLDCVTTLEKADKLIEKFLNHVKDIGLINKP